MGKEKARWHSLAFLTSHRWQDLFYVMAFCLKLKSKQNWKSGTEKMRNQFERNEDQRWRVPWKNGVVVLLMTFMTKDESHPSSRRCTQTLVEETSILSSTNTFPSFLSLCWISRMQTWVVFYQLFLFSLSLALSTLIWHTGSLVSCFLRRWDVH